MIALAAQLQLRTLSIENENHRNPPVLSNQLKNFKGTVQRDGCYRYFSLYQSIDLPLTKARRAKIQTFIKGKVHVESFQVFSASQN